MGLKQVRFHEKKNVKNGSGLAKSQQLQIAFMLFVLPIVKVCVEKISRIYRINMKILLLNSNAEAYFGHVHLVICGS